MMATNMTQTQKSAGLVELKPNSTLLDPNFNGYKLSLEKLPTYELSVKTGGLGLTNNHNYATHANLKFDHIVMCNVIILFAFRSGQGTTVGTAVFITTCETICSSQSYFQ